MMTKSELEKFCVDALLIRKHGVYLYIVDNFVPKIDGRVAEYRSRLDARNYMNDTPGNIWKELFPEFPIDMLNEDVFDLHVIYYEHVKNIIRENSNPGLQLQLLPLFSVEPNYKHGKKSTYWYDSYDYGHWKDLQSDKTKLIQKIFKKENKNVD
jgi:hypothetical protein